MNERSRMGRLAAMAAGVSDGGRRAAAEEGGITLPTTGGGTPPPAANVAGVFLDAAVEGLDYEAGTAARPDQRQGRVRLQEGDTVRFSLARWRSAAPPAAPPSPRSRWPTCRPRLRA
ncbi:hypothetical protein [Variovorax sp. WS11]|uniref:hypothetical protein n=1 Tax=Variovorax sp. WS11 TaxID=1105204 RepID=UPI001EF16E3F|nr:hypothetical protein [Variovorax sp. WS11]